MHILIATHRAAELANFADALATGTGGQLRFADSYADVVSTVKNMPPAFVVLDEGLADGTPLELAKRLLMVNAMINTAVLSPLSAEEFHEASEGLGILAAVPITPGAAEGQGLAEVFRRFI